MCCPLSCKIIGKTRGDVFHQMKQISCTRLILTQLICLIWQYLFLAWDILSAKTVLTATFVLTTHRSISLLSEYSNPHLIFPEAFFLHLNLCSACNSPNFDLLCPIHYRLILSQTLFTKLGSLSWFHYLAYPVQISRLSFPNQPF